MRTQKTPHRANGRYLNLGKILHNNQHAFPRGIQSTLQLTVFQGCARIWQQHLHNTAIAMRIQDRF